MHIHQAIQFIETKILIFRVCSFDHHAFTVPSHSIALIAKRNTGRSWIIRDLLFYYNNLNKNND